MTVETLKDCNKKILARMAKEQSIIGWHAMRKDQLIKALTPVPAGTRKNTSKEAAKVSSRSAAASPASKKAVILPPRPLLPPPRSLRSLDHNCGKDRMIVMVRDPFWLHAYWQLSRSTLGRAQAALGQEWHTAKPILRVMDVSSEDTTSSTERHVRDIPIHGGVNNWYVDVNAPPRSFRVDVGYLSRRGKFFVLARSNVVNTPRAGATDVLDQNWSSVQDQYKKIYHQSGGSMPNGNSTDLREIFEEVLRRPMHSLSLQSLGSGAMPMPARGFHFEVDAELIVYGSTEPNAKVTLQGEPVQLRPDGTFTVRFSLPDARQIIPAVASSPDGVEERTIVLAVERNTKELEPMIHDGNEL